MIHVRFDENPAAIAAKLTMARAEIRAAVRKAALTMTGQNDVQKAQDAPKDPAKGKDAPKRENVAQEGDAAAKRPVRATDVKVGNATPSGPTRRYPQ